MGHAACTQIKLLQCGAPSSGMYDKIGFKLPDFTVGIRHHAKARAVLLYCRHQCTDVYFDADLTEFFHQNVDEIGAEVRKHSRTSLEDSDLGSCACSDVGELRGNVAAPHQHNALRHVVEHKEILVCGKVLLARNS